MGVPRADLVGSTSTFPLCIQSQEIWETQEMICYVLAMGKQHLGSHVVVGYGIKFLVGPFYYVTRSPGSRKMMKRDASRHVDTGQSQACWKGGAGRAFWSSVHVGSTWLRFLINEATRELLLSHTDCLLSEQIPNSQSGNNKTPRVMSVLYLKL